MVPVTFNLEIDKTRPIFDLIMIPDDIDQEEHSESWQLSGVDADYVREHGVSQSMGEDLFHRWYEKLGLGSRNRITPLAHNWKFDAGFISKWLGFDSYQQLFDGRHRDSLSLAISINDAHELAGLEVPFPKQNLSYLCNKMDVKLEDAHRALEDCSATIELYRKLTKRVAANL